MRIRWRIRINRITIENNGTCRCASHIPFSFREEFQRRAPPPLARDHPTGARSSLMAGDFKGDGVPFGRKNPKKPVVSWQGIPMVILLLPRICPTCSRCIQNSDLSTVQFASCSLIFRNSTLVRIALPYAVGIHFNQLILLQDRRYQYSLKVFFRAL